MENKIYKEAILDAKALRASAIANAKSMMQEAIEPAIQEMMRLKLSEELEEDTLEEELEETYDEGEIEEYGDEQPIATKDAVEMSEDAEEEVTEATLEEILAELEALEEDSTLNEEEEEEGEDVEDEEAEETDGSETKDVSDSKEIRITYGELKNALFPYAETEEEGEEDMEAGDETTPVSLDEILAELEEKEEGKGHINEDAGTLIGGLVGLGLGLSTLAPYAIAKVKPYIAKLMGKPTVSDEEIKNLDAEALKGLIASKGSIGEADKMHAMEEELAVAKETIETLRESINEINLLNAKLLYMNKIFKAKNLTESQKVKVVKAFDRSTSVKEVKNTYEVLKESIETKKSQLKESVGFASKPIGSVAKNNIIEADPFINRWQKIAGIK